jgi:hypothetical protein
MEARHADTGNPRYSISSYSVATLEGVASRRIGERRVVVVLSGARRWFDAMGSESPSCLLVRVMSVMTAGHYG